MRVAPTLLFLAASLQGQDLAPRAYLVAPKGTSAITVSAAFNRGDINFDPSLPIKDASANIRMPILSAYYAFGLFGRSANILASLPYATGSFQGTLYDTFQQVHRSGLADMRVRLAANLYGGKAMSLPEFAKYNERTTLGASLTVLIPSGQYDPARLVNTGSNRWALKPELGFTRRRGHWAVDLYGGAWIYFTNHHYYPGNTVRTQAAIANGEAHIGYYLTPRLWVSFDANFWSGGRTVRNGLVDNNEQRNSRMGATVSLPIRQRQSFKFSYSRGAYITIGGDYNTVSVAWQYTWFRRPKSASFQ